MRHWFGITSFLALGGLSLGLGWALSDDATPVPQPPRPKDAVQDVQTPGAPAGDRPEQNKNEHDRSSLFLATQARPITHALDNQPRGGEITGFDFYRDPLNTDKPMTTFEEVLKQDVADKPKVMLAQRSCWRNATISSQSSTPK